MATHLCDELVARGHEVVGIDNFSKYGPLAKSYDGQPGKYEAYFSDKPGDGD